MEQPLSEVLYSKLNKNNVMFELERFGRSYYVRHIMPLGSVREFPFNDLASAKEYWDILT